MKELKTEEGKLSFKERVRQNKIIYIILVISTLILPVMGILMTFTDFAYKYDFINPYNLLWLSFYSIILLNVFYKINWFSIVIAILNILIIVVLLIGSLLGGVQGLFTTLVKMILPIIPFDWAWKLSLKVYPLN